MKTIPMLQRHDHQRPPACIWTKAGVVRHRMCRHDFNCPECRFDMAMLRALEKNQRSRRSAGATTAKRAQLVHWRDELRKRPPAQQPCLHYLKERIRFRACTHDYRCADCEFDQYFDDQFTVHAVVNAVSVLNVDGIQLPQGAYLHRGHAWAVLEGDGGVRVGLDDFARRLIGPPDKLQAPLMGKRITQGQPMVTMHRDNQHVEFVAPVSGVVTGTNPQLLRNPRLLHRDPYGEGWVLRLYAPSLRSELRHLMLGNEAVGYLRSSLDRLFEAIEAVVPLAADGGHPGEDILGNLPELDWETTTRRFFSP